MDNLRSIVAHLFLSLAREFQWDNRQREAAKRLIDITVIRIEDTLSAAASASPRCPHCGLHCGHHREVYAVPAPDPTDALNLLNRLHRDISAVRMLIERKQIITADEAAQIRMLAAWEFAVGQVNIALSSSPSAERAKEEP